MHYFHTVFHLYYYTKVQLGVELNTLCLPFFLLSQVEQSKVLIKEGGVQLLLTIVDTPGFGDAVDNSNW